MDELHAHVRSFAGRPVREPGADLAGRDPATVAWRIAPGRRNPATDPSGAAFERRLRQLFDTVDPTSVRALVLGGWSEMFDEPPVELLVSHAERMPNLTAVFLGDITISECWKIATIQQADVTPVLRAYPRLEVLRVRGSADLALTPLRHEHLRELTFESNEVPPEVVRAIGASDLPALRRLELWIGTEQFSSVATVDDLRPVLSGRRLPALRELGLRNAAAADDIAAALATAPVVARLTDLDLSLGALSDIGAEALLRGRSLTHLRLLDLTFNYLSEEMEERLADALDGVEVLVDESQLEQWESDGLDDRWVFLDDDYRR